LPVIARFGAEWPMLKEAVTSFSRHRTRHALDKSDRSA